jgi:VanZ family protein
MRRWFPFIAWAVFVGCVVASADCGLMRTFFEWYEQRPFADKLGHIGLIGMMTFLLDHAMAGRKIGRSPVPLAAVIVFFVMTLEETSQFWIPSRDFEFGDLFANYTGIVLAVIASRIPRIGKLCSQNFQ